MKLSTKLSLIAGIAGVIAGPHPDRSRMPSADDLVRSLYPPKSNHKPRIPWASDEEKIRRAKEKRERKRGAVMGGILKLTSRQKEICWRCCGRREVQCIQLDPNPSGYEPCPECKATGYGESLETLWKRKGITPNNGKASK